MAKREEVWKNVSSTTTTTQDIKLNCTVESLKAVADAVTRLQTRVDFLEQDMYMILKEIYNLKENVVKKEEKDDDILYQPKKKQRILVENESLKKKNKDESSLLRE